MKEMPQLYALHELPELMLKSNNLANDEKT